MKLEKLWVKDFKNLKDFQIDFDQEQMTTVLIGHNGMGKSNLIEAIVIIYRDLDLGNPPVFEYDLNYFCKGNKIRIKAEPEKRNYAIVVNGKNISFSKFNEENRQVDKKNIPNRKYLPNYLFAYYSGNSERLESHFNTHQKKFYDDLLKNNDKPLRPLFYARLVHSQFVLLSYFLYGDQDSRDFLHQCLDISGLESILFVLKKPRWKSKEGDKRFWNAKGVVQSFLSELYKYSLAPIYNTETVYPEYNKTKREEHLYLFIQNEEKLKELTKKYESNTDFFKILESTYISELISEVQIKVKKESSNCKLIFKELSEGEQQLLTVLGLLKFTQDEESLFLLDEPDTHLNPVWKLEYLNLLEKVVGKNKTSHILISTHDPIVISGLVKDQVIIFEEDKKSNKILTRNPEVDPKGMGVAALLTSELFGLSTTLDIETQQKLDRKREIFLKSFETKLTSEELLEMRELTDELGSLDFTKTIRDPLYDKFVKA
ncbi:MAG: AAA family ATPase, partial [Methanosarcina sp.]|nr:AAA family ATPase [Methanosarcina sp.]